MIHRSRLVYLLMLLFAATSVFADSTQRAVSLSPARDATLIEDGAGGFGNGSGPVLLAGRTNQGMGAIRRALLQFDVSASVPPTARITAVTLILNSSGNNQALDTFDLYRVVGDWGEGGSVSDGGPGVAAAPGDATWLHRFHNPAAPESSPSWDLPGGDFVPRPSASVELSGPGFYSWSSPRMVHDVQAWVSGRAAESGWMLIGNEDSAGTTRRFDSRESAAIGLRPLLIVEYTERGRRPNHDADSDSED